MLKGENSNTPSRAEMLKETPKDSKMKETPKDTKETPKDMKETPIITRHVVDMILNQLDSQLAICKLSRAEMLKETPKDSKMKWNYLTEMNVYPII
jgi:hypothetical protein